VKEAVVRASDPEAPLECLLTPEDGRRRQPAMEDLFARLDRQEQPKSGTRFAFKGDALELWGLVNAFVAEEAVCCPFYDFHITETAEGVELEVGLPPQRVEIEGL
jgi:hypothetical protein